MLELLLQKVAGATDDGLGFAAKQGLDLLRLSRAAHAVNRGKNEKALRVLGELWRLDTLEEELRGPSLLCYAVAAHRAGRLPESEAALEKLLAYGVEPSLWEEGALLLCEGRAIRRQDGDRAASWLADAAPAHHLQTIRALLEVEIGAGRLSVIAPPSPERPALGPRKTLLFPGVSLQEPESFVGARSRYLEGLLSQRQGDILEARRLMQEARDRARRSIYGQWAKEALAELPPEMSGPFR